MIGMLIGLGIGTAGLVLFLILSKSKKKVDYKKVEVGIERKKVKEILEKQKKESHERIKMLSPEEKANELNEKIKRFIK